MFDNSQRRLSSSWRENAPHTQAGTTNNSNSNDTNNTPSTDDVSTLRQRTVNNTDNTTNSSDGDVPPPPLEVVPGVAPAFSPTNGVAQQLLHQQQQLSHQQDAALVGENGEFLDDALVGENGEEESGERSARWCCAAVLGFLAAAGLGTLVVLNTWWPSCLSPKTFYRGRGQSYAVVEMNTFRDEDDEMYSTWEYVTSITDPGEVKLYLHETESFAQHRIFQQLQKQGALRELKADEVSARNGGRGDFRVSPLECEPNRLTDLTGKVYEMDFLPYLEGMEMQSIYSEYGKWKLSDAEEIDCWRHFGKRKDVTESNSAVSEINAMTRLWAPGLNEEVFHDWDPAKKEQLLKDAAEVEISRLASTSMNPDHNFLGMFAGNTKKDPKLEEIVSFKELDQKTNTFTVKAPTPAAFTEITRLLRNDDNRALNELTADKDWNFTEDEMHQVEFDWDKMDKFKRDVENQTLRYMKRVHQPLRNDRLFYWMMSSLDGRSSYKNFVAHACENKTPEQREMLDMVHENFELWMRRKSAVLSCAKLYPAHKVKLYGIIHPETGLLEIDRDRRTRENRRRFNRCFETFRWRQHSAVRQVQYTFVKLDSHSELQELKRELRERSAALAEELRKEGGLHMNALEQEQQAAGGARMKELFQKPLRVQRGEEDFWAMTRERFNPCGTQGAGCCPGGCCAWLHCPRCICFTGAAAVAPELIFLVMKSRWTRLPICSVQYLGFVLIGALVLALLLVVFGVSHVTVEGIPLWAYLRYGQKKRAAMRALAVHQGDPYATGLTHSEGLSSYWNGFVHGFANGPSAQDGHYYGAPDQGFYAGENFYPHDDAANAILYEPPANHGTFQNPYEPPAPRPGGAGGGAPHTGGGGGGDTNTDGSSNFLAGYPPYGPANGTDRSSAANTGSDDAVGGSSLQHGEPGTIDSNFEYPSSEEINAMREAEKRNKHGYRDNAALDGAGALADARPPRVVKAAQAVKNAKEAGGPPGGTAPRVEIGDLRALGNQGKKSTGFGGMGVGRNIVEQHEAEGGRRRLNQDGAKKEDGAVPQHINIDHAGKTLMTIGAQNLTPEQSGSGGASSTSGNRRAQADNLALKIEETAIFTNSELPAHQNPSAIHLFSSDTSSGIEGGFALPSGVATNAASTRPASTATKASGDRDSSAPASRTKSHQTQASASSEARSSGTASAAAGSGSSGSEPPLLVQGVPAQQMVGRLQFVGAEMSGINVPVSATPAQPAAQEAAAVPVVEVVQTEIMSENVQAEVLVQGEMPVGKQQAEGPKAPKRW